MAVRVTKQTIVLLSKTLSTYVLFRLFLQLLAKLRHNNWPEAIAKVQSCKYRRSGQGPPPAGCGVLDPAHYDVRKIDSARTWQLMERLKIAPLSIVRKRGAFL
jgi:hypothetical protein